MLYLLQCGNLYGTERMALATLVGMEEYDKRVVFAPSPSGSASVAVAAREAGFETITFHSRWQLVKSLLPWLLRYRSVDAICTGVGQNFICYWLAKLFRVKLRQIHVTHAGTIEWHAYGTKRFLNRIPVRMVAVSEFVREKLVAYGVRPEAITVIHNFLPDTQKQTWPSRLPYESKEGPARTVDPSKVKVAIVSRVDAFKKVDLLVRAVEEHGLADFDFDIYGTGDDLDALRERSATLPNIHFHGFVSDVNRRLAAADFLLHLCPEEPFGLVILEAFLSKVVTIVPDAGGAGSLVQHLVNGLKFKADDSADLCRVLDEARALPAGELQRLSEAGSKALDERFSQRDGVNRYREALSVGVPEQV
jgi:glycosyltransferase involved in cell wall biosynthesis